jgi:hypothetical protein
MINLLGDKIVKKIFALGVCALALCAGAVNAQKPVTVGGRGPSGAGSRPLTVCSLPVPI